MTIKRVSVLSFICLLGFLCVVLITSCGKKGQIALTLRLPAGVSKGTARYERFLKRVVNLKIEFKSKAGIEQAVVLPPQDWERLPIPELGFPANGSDQLSINAEIWDQNLEGAPRSYPVASGSAQVESDAIKGGEIVQVVIPLSLKVAVREYDF